MVQKVPALLVLHELAQCLPLSLDEDEDDGFEGDGYSDGDDSESSEYDDSEEEEESDSEDSEGEQENRQRRSNTATKVYNIILVYIISTACMHACKSFLSQDCECTEKGPLKMKLQQKIHQVRDCYCNMSTIT